MQPVAATGWRPRPRRACTPAGGYPLEFGTISVSDGISMGHEGMHFSLVSREVIADSVETVMQAERLDGSVLLAGCDKSLPGHADGRGAARPGLASSCTPARSCPASPSCPTAPSARSRSSTPSRRSAPAPRGLIPREDVDAIERAICPGEGACGGMYTANTMASRGRGARHVAARAAPRRRPPTAAATASPAGPARPSSSCCAQGITARQIMTKEAFENAIAVVMALGGSTNAVLHLLAIAHEAEVDLTLDDFNRIGDRGAAPGRRQAVRPLRHDRRRPRSAASRSS